MSHLITVAALHIGHVLGLGALFGGVTILLTIVALHDARLVALGALVALLATVATSHWAATSRTVLREVTDLITCLACNSLSGTRLGALLRVVSGLLTVAACKGIDALLGAIAGTMANLVADDALDLGAFDNLGGLLFAPFLNVAKLTTIAALGNTAIEWHACSLLEAFNVLLGCSWPALSEIAAHGLGTPVESQLELLVNGTGGADEGEDIADFIFLSRV